MDVGPKTPCNGNVAKGNGHSAPRRPGRDPSGFLTRPHPAGSVVQYFHRANAGDRRAALLSMPSWAPPSGSPRLLRTHGWTSGTLAQDFDPTQFDRTQSSTWPLVEPHCSTLFATRSGERVSAAHETQRALLVRDLSGAPPLLSLVLVRWGGAYSEWMDKQEANDGDWGLYGSPPSDEYMQSLVDVGVVGHPELMGSEGDRCDLEVFALFITGSEDLMYLASEGVARKLVAQLRGRKRASFWMLWPVEWVDTGDPDYACYVERNACFAAQRACEAVMLRSGFPHPSDLYDTIVSKSWMATLALLPGVHLPAATHVAREDVLLDRKAAALAALNALQNIRALNPLPADSKEHPNPSFANADGIRAGVVKLGWSWENRFVSSFDGLEHLEQILIEMMHQPGLTSSSCIVQEWVDFDFEMRAYFLPPQGEWVPGVPILPVRCECNAWGKRDEGCGLGTSPSSFRKLSHKHVMQRWQGDAQAFANAKDEAVRIAHLLLVWLRTVNCRPVPFIRLDFMLKRLGPGKARVIFGEFCEMGACVLGWQDGPPAVWRAAVSAVLH